MSADPLILIVDDTPENIKLLAGLLKIKYRTKVANHGEKALRLAAADPRPDLILLDVMMPEMDGYEVCRRLKLDRRTRDIPVIFLTARSEVEDETHGLELGAVDYITKPISPPILWARVNTQLQLKESRDLLRRQNEELELRVEERTAQLSAVQDVTMLAMGSLAETRDNETGNHIRRTQHYVRCLAGRLREFPRDRDILTPDYIQQLYKSAPLHDIGKVGVPDRVLLKPGPLTAEEFEVMKAHCRLGRDAILQAERALDEPQRFLRLAREIAYGHHEKWDGSGYPEGLAGEAIPLSARLMAVADVYDALISRRVYKEPVPHLDAVAIIREGRGSHFDPLVVDAFEQAVGEFAAIAERFRDDYSMGGGG